MNTISKNMNAKWRTHMLHEQIQRKWMEKHIMVCLAGVPFAKGKSSDCSNVAILIQKPPIEIVWPRIRPRIHPPFHQRYAAREILAGVAPRSRVRIGIRSIVLGGSEPSVKISVPWGRWWPTKWRWMTNQVCVAFWVPAFRRKEVFGSDCLYA